MKEVRGNKAEEVSFNKDIKSWSSRAYWGPVNIEWLKHMLKGKKGKYLRF